jgi:hypothetical protein
LRSGSFGRHDATPSETLSQEDSQKRKDGGQGVEQLEPPQAAFDLVGNVYDSLGNGAFIVEPASHAELASFRQRLTAAATGSGLIRHDNLLSTE